MIGETPNLPALGDAGHKQTPVNLAISSDFGAPLGLTTRGRFIFASGAAGVHLEAASDRAELYDAHFEQQIPSVRVQEGIVTIHYRRNLFVDGSTHLPEPLARIGLNTTVPWEIEFREGVSHLNAALRDLQVHALDLGSVSTALLILPAPTGLANIYLSGSASDLTLLRPPDVAMRLQIAGAASQLTLDKQHYGACGVGLRWQSEDYHASAHRYDVAIAGSVSNLTIAIQ